MPTFEFIMPFFNKRNLLFLCFVLLQYVASADAYLYDDSRGLSNNAINKVIKDRSGLLWIATGSGLNSFDGYSFKEVAEFKKKTINTLAYDSVSNVMWVGADDGLFSLNLTTNSIFNYTANFKAKRVLHIFSNKGCFYVQFKHGLIVEINNQGEFRLVFSLNKLGFYNKEFRSIAAINDSCCLFVVINDCPSLVKLNIKSGAHRFLPNVPVKNLLNITTIDGQCYALDNNTGATFLGHGVGDAVFTQKQPHGFRLDMIYKFNNEYYASLRGFYGCYKYNLAAQKWILIEDDYDVSYRSKTISTILRDAHDVLWLGTNKGLIKLTLPPPDIFKTLFDGYMPFVSTRQIFEKNKDEFFIATLNGLYTYDLARNKAVLIDSTGKDGEFPIYTRALHYDGGKYIIGGTESSENIIYRIDLNTGKCEGGFFTREPEGIKLSSVYSILKATENGVLWLATDKGLATFNTITNKVNVFVSGIFNMRETRLFYLAKARAHGKFWVAGRGSIFLVDEQKGIEKTYTVNASNGFKLVDDDYIFVGEDDYGKLWVGTKRTGMLVLDFAKQETEHITTVQGLSANEVYGVLWQNKRIGWISTVKGLCRYDVQEKSFNNYFIDDGLSDNECNQNSLLKSSNGLFYFGGINGVNYFNPTKIQPKNEPLRIFNASVMKWNDGGQTFVQLNPKDVIKMKPQDHLLSFSFGLSDYSNVEACTYFYKIDGIHSNWISLGNQNTLRLDGLPAGSYHLQVMGYNKRGIRSENVLEYNLEIVQVFYKTWWFYVVLALLVVLIVYGYFKWHLQNIKQNLRLRTQIASNLHDEVGSLLTSIIISTDGARYGAETVEEKDEKLERISALSREATGTMSDVLWSIDARNDYTGNFTDRMREQAELMLVPLDIEVEFDLSGAQQHQNIAPEIRQQLYLIFKEAINNIVKHGHATLVKVTYTQIGKKFVLRVENNNHQIVLEEHKYTGQGLKNMSMRAQKIGATFSVQQQSGVFVVEVKN